MMKTMVMAATGGKRTKKMILFFGHRLIEKGETTIAKGLIKGINIGHIWKSRRSDPTV